MSELSPRQRKNGKMKGKCANTPLIKHLKHTYSFILCKLLSIQRAGGQVLCASVFSPEFLGQRAQIISDPAPHLECSDSQYQILVVCVPLSTKDSKLSSMFTEFCSQSPDSS